MHFPSSWKRKITRKNTPGLGPVLDYINLYLLSLLGDRSQTRWGGGLMQNGGPLKILTLLKGDAELKKNNHKFSWKIEFIWFSWRLTHNFQVKKGGPEIFEVWKGARKMFCDEIFCIRPGCLENGARKQGRNVPVFWPRFRDPTWVTSKMGRKTGTPGFLYFFLQVKHAKLFYTPSSFF